MRQFLFAFLAAFITIVVLSFLSRTQAISAAACLLSAISAVYVGSALSGQNNKALLIQSTVALLFLLVSVMGCWASPLFLVAGYYAHGLWDWVHHTHTVKTKITNWYPPFCLAYDWIVATYIAIKL